MCYGGSSNLTRHPLYYFPNANHIFQVENVLYKLLDDVLAADSVVFRDMFSIPKPSKQLDTGVPIVTEGKVDTCPIVLGDVEVQTFDMYVEHLFGRPRPGSSYSHAELKDFLHFCDKYQCEMTRKFVINRINAAKFGFHPADILNLGLQYQIKDFFIFGFNQLLDIPLTQITKEHRGLMGHDAFIGLVYSKALLDEHSRIVAAEEPQILSHADGCQDPLACEEDWHSAWWNGMGRFLLDGRNPQPYYEAVKRFKEFDFGRVNHGCKLLMFSIIDRGEAFDYADNFISDICQRLAVQLIFEPGSPPQA